MIRLKKVSKIYNASLTSQTLALDEIDLEVTQGEFLMIMGRSGCGKTTLLNLIGCIDRYEKGEYYFHDIDIKNLKEKELSKLRREKMGYIYQSFNLIEDLNCLENIELTQGYAGVPEKIRHKNVRELLERLGLADKEKSLPAQLSGGQKQRIAIARAISNSPEIILADEPTGNLDYNTGMETMNLLAQLNSEGATIIMVTHDKELTLYASRVLIMQDGKFINDN